MIPHCTIGESIGTTEDLTLFGPISDAIAHPNRQRRKNLRRTAERPRKSYSRRLPELADRIGKLQGMLRDAAAAADDRFGAVLELAADIFATADELLARAALGTVRPEAFVGLTVNEALLLLAETEVRYGR